MNWKTAMYVFAVGCYIIDGIITYAYVIAGWFGHYGDVHVINTTLAGLLYEHGVMILLITVMAVLLRYVKKNRVYAIWMGIAGACTFYPVILNLVLIL